MFSLVCAPNIYIIRVLLKVKLVNPYCFCSEYYYYYYDSSNVKVLFFKTVHVSPKPFDGLVRSPSKTPGT